jgi:phosphoribosylglycinamide formyltransferase-1
VISNNKSAYALERARKAQIPAFYLSETKLGSPERLDQALVEKFQQYQVDLVILAGYMKKIGPLVLSVYQNRVLNIHPALLPRFGGKKMYGLAVHRAVLESGAKESGVTVHLVDEIYDHGRILAQKKVPVLPGDTPEKLAARVLKEEHKLYPEVIQKIALGEIKLMEGKE